MLKIHYNSRGQTLIEALVALTAIVIIMTATTIAVISSLNNASTIKSQNIVNKLGQQGMEYIRDRIVNADMFTLYSTLGAAPGASYCLNSSYGLTTTFRGPVPPCSQENYIDGKYARIVSFLTADCDTGAAQDFAQGLKVTIAVKWTDGKCNSTTFCHQNKIVSCFTNPATAIPTTAQGI